MTELKPLAETRASLRSEIGPAPISSGARRAEFSATPLVNFAELRQLLDALDDADRVYRRVAAAVGTIRDSAIDGIRARDANSHYEHEAPSSRTHTKSIVRGKDRRFLLKLIDDVWDALVAPTEPGGRPTNPDPESVGTWLREPLRVSAEMMQAYEWVTEIREALESGRGVAVDPPANPTIALGHGFTEGRSRE